jgi:alpha-N-arabinofuranosidase
MKQRSMIKWLAMASSLFAISTSAQAPPSNVQTIIRPSQSRVGTIDQRLFGNFIELLNDVVPGMWAEMLNDRSFEGVLPLSNWCYYDGAPDICDRQWDTNSTWQLDTQNPFNGARSARLAASRSKPASLTQSGLSTKAGVTYTFSGYLRSENPGLNMSLILKTLLPNGKWMTLGSTKVSSLTQRWEKHAARLVSAGATDRAVFELKVEGTGSLWADKLSLMPADNLSGWRRDVIETIKEVRPSIVRWGGSVCDPGGYRWKNGIGDRELRTPFPNKVWGRLDPNDVGVDEFCQFCEFVGVEPLICLSFSDGPESAGDQVEYCNGDTRTTWGARRAANGHPAPYHVKYWQVGNEISGDDTNYLNQFGAFARLMKQRDPSIQLMTSYPGRQLLERSGADISFICPHHYTTDFPACTREFESLTSMIETIPNCSNIKIAVTEWNVSGGDWGLGRGRQQTLETALQNARYLHVMMRHSDKVKIGCRSNMANSFCGAIIETSPSGVLRRPSYYIMQLYALHAMPLPMEVVTPADGPDVFACSSEDKKTMTVFAVNSKAQPVNLGIRFDGFGGAARPTRAKSVCDEFNAGQLDIMNHWANPERIRIRTLAVTADGVVLPPLSATAVECEAR